MAESMDDNLIQLRTEIKDLFVTQLQHGTDEFNNLLEDILTNARATWAYELGVKDGEAYKSGYAAGVVEALKDVEVRHHEST